jgi:hypothetical protein
MGGQDANVVTDYILKVYIATFSLKPSNEKF